MKRHRSRKADRGGKDDNEEEIEKVKVEEKRGRKRKEEGNDGWEMGVKVR